MIITVSPAGEEMLQLVYEKAKTLFTSLVSNIIISPINGYKTFFIATNGSKYGWEDYEQHENRRRQLADYIDSFKFEDNSNCIQFIDVSYDEDYSVEVERTNFR